MIKLVFIMTTDFYLQVHRTFERSEQSDTISASTDIFAARMHPGVHSNSKLQSVNCHKQLHYNVKFIILKLMTLGGNKEGRIHSQRTEVSISVSTKLLKTRKRKIRFISSLTNYKKHFLNSPLIPVYA
jgi:hypothetical protein